MTPIRVLLAQMPPMLRDIIRGAVTNEPDVQEVGCLGIHEPFFPVLETVRADVLILGETPPNDLELAEEVWEKWPHVKVLMIANGGRSAALHALQPHKVLLGDVSAESVLAAIRGTPPW